MNRRLLLLATPALLGLAACGGGSSSSGTAVVHGLAYSNPTSYTSQYALILDTANSTPTNLVLDVVGPQGGESAVGVTFGFDVDTRKAAWVTTPVLTNGTLWSGSSLVARGWVNGTTLQGIVSYKGLNQSVADIGSNKGVIARIALTPVTGAATGAVTLTAVDLGSKLDSGGTPYKEAFAVGTLTLN